MHLVPELAVLLVYQPHLLQEVIGAHQVFAIFAVVTGHGIHLQNRTNQRQYGPIHTDQQAYKYAFVRFLIVDYRSSTMRLLKQHDGQEETAYSAGDGEHG